MLPRFLAVGATVLVASLSATPVASAVSEPGLSIATTASCDRQVTFGDVYAVDIVWYRHMSCKEARSFVRAAQKGTPHGWHCHSAPYRGGPSSPSVCKSGRREVELEGE
jgi:hypothetical protein